MGPSTGNAFDRLRLEAKCLLKDVRRGDEAATRRFTQYWPATGPSGEVRNLARAQLVIARERGYRSWAHLKTSLLGNEERVMSEQKNAVVPERRLGVYTYEEAESLLGIPAEELRKLVEQIEKKPLRYLDAITLEHVWAAAKPFLVTLKRNDDRPVTREDARIVQEAILNAGGILAMHMAQFRVATREEAEREAMRQHPVPGYTWVAYEMGLEKTMDGLKTVWSDLVQKAY
jgi:hypothetical protein